MLLVDIGNTRIKGAIYSGDRLAELPTLPTTASERFTEWFEMIVGRARPHRILVSNVAGVEVAGAFGQSAFEHCQVEPEFVRPQRQCAGMVTRYVDPEQLGVDRWLAALAAFCSSSAPVCVVDAGTAITVDVVDRNGEHLGGLIAPGLELMRLSLMSGTAQLESTGIDSVPDLATNTRDAISLGCLDATRGLLSSVHGRLRAGFPSSNFIWYLTGGGAEAIANLMPVECIRAPDLVLRGLAIVAEQHP